MQSTLRALETCWSWLLAGRSRADCSVACLRTRVGLQEYKARSWTAGFVMSLNSMAWDFQRTLRACALRTAMDEEVVGIDVSVKLGGVDVVSGDVLIADVDGIVVIPSADASDVLADRSTRSPRSPSADGATGWYVVARGIRHVRRPLGVRFMRWSRLRIRGRAGGRVVAVGSGVRLEALRHRGVALRPLGARVTITGRMPVGVPYGQR